MLSMPIALASLTLPAQAATTDRFGAPQTMRCIWFSNFENSRFKRCTLRGRSILADGATPVFAGDVARAFDARARRLVGAAAGEAPWGRFEVEIVGRLAKTRRSRPRFLRDALNTVRVDRLLSIRLIRNRT